MLFGGCARPYVQCNDTISCREQRMERDAAFFVDPQQPAKPTSCTLKLGTPKEADQVYLHPFDRAGQPYAYWVSMWTYDGGTPPSEEQQARQHTAKGCGVVKVDPRSCAVTREL